MGNLNSDTQIAKAFMNRLYLATHDNKIRWEKYSNNLIKTTFEDKNLSLKYNKPSLSNDIWEVYVDNKLIKSSFIRREKDKNIGNHNGNLEFGAWIWQDFQLQEQIKGLDLSKPMNIFEEVFSYFKEYINILIWGVKDAFRFG